METSTLFVAFLFLSCSWWWYISTRSNKNLAPGPLALPLVGHLHLLGKDPYKSLSTLSKKYGSIMRIKMGMIPTLVVSSPEAAKAVLSTHDSFFASRPRLAAFVSLFYNAKDMAFCEYGPHWRKNRKICNTELFTGKRVEQSKKLRMEEVSRLVNSIAYEGHNGEVPVELNAKLSMANMNMVSLTAFHQRFDDPELVETLQETVDLLGAFVPGDYFPFLRWMNDVRRMKLVHQKLNTVFQQMIDERRQKLETERGAATATVPDLIEVLLPLEEFNDNDRKALIMDILSAGTDPATIVTEWALAELVKDPSFMTKAQQEIDQIVGHDRVVTEEDIPKLSYLRALVKETFRFHPPAPLLIPHQSMKDCTVNGFFVPANTRLLVNVWSIGMDPKLWESPEVFNPDRFLESPLDVKGQHFELIPFGSGRRMCAGMGLGLIMVEITLARLIQAFEWKITDHGLDMEEDFKITLKKKVPLRCFATPRKSLANLKV